MNKREVINIEILDFQKGGIVRQNDQRFFVAVERAPTIYRVNDGTYDFTFTQSELDNAIWLREVS